MYMFIQRLILVESLQEHPHYLLAGRYSSLYRAFCGQAEALDSHNSRGVELLRLWLRAVSRRRRGRGRLAG